MSSFFKAARQFLPEIAALAVVTIWGTNFVFQKAALAEFDVFAFSFLRFAGMLALSWLVLFLRRQARKPNSGRSKTTESLAVARKDIPRMVLLGILGFTLYIQISAVGLNYTTAFSSALLIATSPLFVAGLLLVFRLEQIRLWQWLALLLALVGVVIFLLDKAQAGFNSASLGDLISLVGAFCYAAYNVVNKPLLNRYPSPVLTAYTLTFGVIPALLLSWPALLGQDWSRITLAGWGALAWGIVFPVYVAWTVWSWISARRGVSRTAVFMYLVPVIGGIASWLLLGEGFGLQKILGALLILSSLVLFRYQPKPKPVEQHAPVASNAMPESVEG
jgi:drug/metabolite transporter (DMT)-like permease